MNRRSGRLEATRYLYLKVVGFRFGGSKTRFLEGKKGV